MRTSLWAIKGDTKSLDYGSYGLKLALGGARLYLNQNPQP